MARILLLHPNRWGRGITALWIPSHTAVLRHRGHEVRLFDCTFFKDWMIDETRFNTANRQYKPSDYENQVVFSDAPVVNALWTEIQSFDPDVVFWGAVSSHIHGEGEYVAIEYGHTLISGLPHPPRAVRIAAGLHDSSGHKAAARQAPALRSVCAPVGLREREFREHGLLSIIMRRYSFGFTIGVFSALPHSDQLL